MKKSAKALLLSLCAVLLVVASVMGTLAYLTSTDEVKNTFTVGSVAISLDEAKVKTDGTVVENADRVQANEYHLLPGHTYTKDPTIHIDDKSETAYLYVKLEVKDNADLKTLLNKYGIDDDFWTLLTGSTFADWSAMNVTGYNDGSGNYLLTYKTTIDGTTADIKLFDSITVPTQFTNEDLARLNEFAINVTAYAIQADGFDTAADAWAAAGSSFTAADGE